ncbi:MAG: GWxTD domain-containing protein [Gemmatimonadetes bacterium]|nr:GWxTD domain-containing protein [Gemmatimonadota bacterium]
MTITVFGFRAALRILFGAPFLLHSSLFPLPSSPVSQGDSVELRAARFYRGAGGTLVDGFAKVPYAILDTLRGAGGKAAYRVQISVRDSSGLELTSSGWSQNVPAEILRFAHASTVEHFAFAAVRGRYDVEVTVIDSASGRRSRATTSIEPYTASPFASDLILTSGIRRALAGDSVPRPGEIRKGSVFLVVATRPVLTPQDEKLYYYVELYPGRAARAELTAQVRATDGRELFSAVPQTSNVSAGGGVAASVLNLGGLPPGSYRLTLDVKLPDTTIARDGEFEVAGFEAAALARGAEAAAPANRADTSFASLNEAQVDSLYLPLMHIMEADERGPYESLSLVGKRNFLRQFWTKRDPSPGTPQNEAREQYYARIAEANQRYREGGAARIPGWRTDRGRIFIRYGDPDETLKRPQSGPTRPYEVWKYTRGRPRKFVFLDDTGFGHYQLIYSDERREPSRSDWEYMLGLEAAADVKRF